MGTGEPKFKKMLNSLTNLNDDSNKRMDCQVTGYPLPKLTWKFQAVDEEVRKEQCGETTDGYCKCTGASCDSEVTAKCDEECAEDQSCKDKCTADYYKENA